MADRRLAVEIVVEGDAVRIFKEIGQAAKTSAQDMESSSRRAKSGLDQMDRAAETTEQSMRELDAAQTRAAKTAGDVGVQTGRAGKSLDQYRASIAAAGAGMALLTGAFTSWSQEARSHEVTVMALERMYGEAADSYVAFADRIQDTSIFSNDQALEAARIMGTLRENYGLTDQQIQQLIQTSADLATMHGLTLTDSAQRVAAAIRGEAESAEALGLTMNQASIDTQGLTLAMTNAEAAAFRVDALMVQAASSVGAAAEAADTTTGKVQQLGNEFQDARMQLVAFTGPVGEVAAGLTSFGADVGFAVAGLGMMVPAATKAATAIRGLSLATMGPVGIVAGLGLAAWGVWELVDALGPSGSPSGLSASFIRASESVGDLNTEVDRLTAGLSNAVLALDIFEGQAAFQPMIDDLNELNTLWGQFGNPDDPFSQPMIEIDENGIAQAVELTGAALAEQEAAFARMREIMGQYGVSADDALAQVEAAMADWANIIGHHGAGAGDALKAAAEAWNTFEASAQTEADFDALTATLDNIANGLNDYDEAALQAAAAAQQFSAEITSQAAAIRVNTDAQIAANAEFRTWLELHGLAQQYDQEQANDPRIGSDAQVNWFAKYQQAIDAAALASMGFSITVQGGSEAFTKFLPAVEGSTRATEDLDRAFGQVSGTMKDDIGVSIAQLEADFNAAMRAASGLSDALYDIRAMRGTATIDLAVNTSGAQNALTSGFGAIVGGAQGMGQIADQTAEWAGSLAHASGEFTELDKLVLKGKISLTTYNAALDANHRIQVANESVQEDVLRIQAKQLPVIAQLAEEHARYVDGLADASVAEQTIALGYMDQAKAAQALQLAQLAATASQAGMTEAAEASITAMAEADPVLKAMLTDMGLIKEGANGEITVEFPNAGGLTTSVDNLKISIDALTTALGGIPPSVTTQVLLTDSASAPLATIKQALADLDGQVSTVYINTIGGGLTLGAATGTFIVPDSQRNIVARVEGMATGGHLRLVGEAGPELVSLPSGTTVTNAAGTRGRLDPMGRGRVRDGNTVIYKGVVHQTITYEESALADRTRRVMSRRKMG